MRLLDTIRLLYHFDSAIGVTCHLHSEGEEYRVCRLVRQKGEIKLEGTATFSSLSDLKAYCENYPKAPVACHFQGRGILVRQLHVEGIVEDDDIKAIFPSFSTETYYATSFVGNGKAWVSLSKKSHIDNLLNTLEDGGVRPVLLLLGPFVLDPILRFLNAYNNEYTFGGHHIKTNDQHLWAEYAYGEQHFANFQAKIGLNPIAQEHITAYACAFNVLMRNYIADHSIEESRSRHQLAERKELVKFKVNLFASLGLLFFMLLVSAVLHSFYLKKNEAYKAYSGTVATIQQDWQERLKTIDVQDTLLSDLGWNGGVSKAWLMDRIGTTLDEYPGIFLTAIQINPMQERKRGSNDQREDNRNRVILQGQCATLSGLHAWIRKLSQEKWVEKARIAQFTPSQRHDDKSNIFRLDIRFGYGL